MFPSLLPDNFFWRSQDSLDSSSKIGWPFLYRSFFLPLLQTPHLTASALHLTALTRETFWWICHPTCPVLWAAQHAGWHQKEPPSRSSQVCLCLQKGAHFSVLPKKSWRILLHALDLEKRCTDQLSRLMGLSKLNLSAKSLGFDLCYKSVKFPTKPLSFCTGKMIE